MCGRGRRPARATRVRRLEAAIRRSRPSEITLAAMSMRGTGWRSSGTTLPMPSARNESCVAMKFNMAPFMCCISHDSFALRELLGLVLPDAPPDHSTISRTRRLIDLKTHQAVFTWMLQRLADAGRSKARRSASTRPRSKPTRHCAASCGATRARATRTSSRSWRRLIAPKTREVRLSSTATTAVV